jgi:hypothetical protein
MGDWVFEELRGAAVRRDPKEAELFRTEQTEEGEYAQTDALVREIIQNSIDAQLGLGPVRVRLALHDERDAPSTTHLAKYFRRLKHPLKGRLGDFSAAGAPREPCRFLVCEDFGTSGLEGDVTLFSDPENGRQRKEDFFWFWRNIGRSGKTGIDLGRWGLGKTVYRAVSRVGCMFGLTVRASDRREMLMGQAVLQIHTFDRKEFQPEGYWCGEQDSKGLPLPVVDSEELIAFRQHWRLTRLFEPGLSVVAPYVPAELQDNRILQAVAVHFFTRILRGELVVEVVGPSVGKVLLDKNGIERACKEILWDGPKRTKRHVSPPIQFARTCLQESPTFTSNVLGKTRAPELNAESFSEDTLKRVRTSFASGELVSVRLRLFLSRRGAEPDEGSVDVYLQRNANGQRCDSYYVREGMTITKIGSRAGAQGVRALVNVDRGPLAELLGDTEGPAHEDWDRSMERPDRNWTRWKNVVSFVRRVVDNLVEYLAPPSQEPDFELLADFFSLPQADSPQKQRRVGSLEKKLAGMEPPTAKEKWFQITERIGGFTVSRSNGLPIPPQASLKVAVAYDVPRGDPLRSWSALDFSIENKSKLSIEGSGVTARRTQGNVVHLEVESEQFRFTLKGFDPHRDLFIRVDDISGLTDEAGTE